MNYLRQNVNNLMKMKHPHLKYGNYTMYLTHITISLSPCCTNVVQMQIIVDGNRQVHQTILHEIKWNQLTQNLTNQSIHLLLSCNITIQRHKITYGIRQSTQISNQRQTIPYHNNKGITILPLQPVAIEVK